MTMTVPPSVLLVEDQKLLRLGLRISLESIGCFRILAEVEDGEAAVRETQRLRPDVVLMDVGLPGIDGIEATWRIKQEVPRTRVIMFTSRTTPDCVTAALGAGADGYCCKDAAVEQIVNAINAVIGGEVWLDPGVARAVAQSRHVNNTRTDDALANMEVQILALIQQGMDNHEIAASLNVSRGRIARVLYNVIDKFAGKTGIEARKDQRSSHAWLTAVVENLNQARVFEDKYLVEELLGSGSMGAVFKAQHLYMNRHVALKLLRSEVREDRFTMRYFQREAMAIANLQHKNIVGVYDFGISSDGEPYLVMEYVRGTNLADVLNSERRLPLHRLMNLCSQICAGLSEAHSKGIIHCDLKPSNILIQGSERQESVKLVDFGLAQETAIDVAPQLRVTDKFFISGTPLYMSPEQCSGAQLDARSDIYSFGCILYEALTGVNVFEGLTTMETFANHMRLIPPPMASHCAGPFSANLEDCVSQMLAKEPASRPQSMEQVMRLLHASTAVCL
jgi:DNA-binding NarL/FixJ family response regulator/tRNA A-37 threonylcarbamoyl transferase component Bud32